MAGEGAQMTAAGAQGRSESKKLDSVSARECGLSGETTVSESSQCHRQAHQSELNRSCSLVEDLVLKQLFQRPQSRVT